MDFGIMTCRLSCTGGSGESGLLFSKREGSERSGLDELIPLSKAAGMSGLSQGHLSLLIRAGKLWGVKIGGNWVTTGTVVNESLARVRSLGPKPNKQLGEPVDD